MAGRTIFEGELETLAAELIRKYPTGFLSEPELLRWEPNPWAIAIRVPDKNGLDSPKAIIRGSYLEIRAFEIAYERARAAYSRPSFKMSACIKSAVEV